MHRCGSRSIRRRAPVGVGSAAGAQNHPIGRQPQSALGFDGVWVDEPRQPRSFVKGHAQTIDLVAKRGVCRARPRRPTLAARACSPIDAKDLAGTRRRSLRLGRPAGRVRRSTTRGGGSPTKSAPVARRWARSTLTTVCARSAAARSSSPSNSGATCRATCRSSSSRTGALRPVPAQGKVVQAQPSFIANSDAAQVSG